jgi:hypothetical protein
MVGFTQTGKRVLMTGVTPRFMGLYWFCDCETVAVRIANIGWDGSSMFAKELISGEIIPEFEFCDYLWCEATESDAESMRRVHTALKIQASAGS